MNRLPSSFEEAEEVMSKGDLYIPPIRLTEISKAASKIVTMLTQPQIFYTYAEMEIVLEVASAILKKGYAIRRE